MRQSSSTIPWGFTLCTCPCFWELVDNFLGGPVLILIVCSVRLDSIERRLRIVLISYSLNHHVSSPIVLSHGIKMPGNN